LQHAENVFASSKPMISAAPKPSEIRRLPFLNGSVAIVSFV
jgi:hypothetical protein